MVQLHNIPSRNKAGYVERALKKKPGIPRRVSKVLQAKRLLDNTTTTADMRNTMFPIDRDVARTPEAKKAVEAEYKARQKALSKRKWTILSRLLYGKKRE